VDFVRSCYRSSWRFYDDAPGVTTFGEYRYAGENAKHLPCLHFFGSRNWRNADDVPNPEHRGEVWGSVQRWSNGSSSTRKPPEIQVGTNANFSEQWDWPVGSIDRTLINGIDSRCFVLANIPLVTAEEVFAVDNPNVQLALAEVIKRLYDDDTIPVTQFFSDWFGPSTVVTHFPRSGLTPRMVLVQTSEFSVVVAEGTSDFQQLAMQAMRSGSGPTDVGSWGTNPLWFDQATIFSQRLETAGVNPATPILFAGHSYGGAILTNLAAKYRVAQPDRNIALLTFGTPKVGDARLAEIVRSMTHQDVANDDDVVISVPFSLVETVSYATSFPLSLFTGWNRYVRPSSSTWLQRDGTRYNSGPPILDGTVIGTIIYRAIVGQRFAPIEPHRMFSYVGRLTHSYFGNPAPIPVSSWQILFGVGPSTQFGVALGGGPDGEIQPSALVGVSVGGSGEVVVSLSVSGDGGFFLA